MITYRVHGPLCHESINGEDMIAVVEAETAQVLYAALRTAVNALDAYADVIDGGSAGQMPNKALVAHGIALVALARAEGR